MRFLDKLLRHDREKPEKDPRLEAALLEKRLKEGKQGIRDRRDLEEYPSRGSVPPL
jgi:hypothetical protein